MADSNVDAVELCLLVATSVDRLLVQDRVEDDRGFTCLAVADDELSLTAADGDQCVDGLEARCHRLVYRFARQDAWRLDVDALSLFGLDWAFAIDRVTQRVHDAAQKRLADRHLDDRSRAFDRVAFLDRPVVAKNHDADVVRLQVQRHTANAAWELDHFAGLYVVETINARDAVADRQHLANFGDLNLFAEILDLILQDGGDLCGPNFHYLPLPYQRFLEQRVGDASPYLH